MAISGSTHFMVGFVLAYLLFRLMLLISPGNHRLGLYAPLMPFGAGLFFALPYLFELGGAGELQHYIGQGVNLFGAYGWLHHNSFVATYLDGLNRVALICGVIYLLIIRHYISLIRHLREQHAG